MPHKSFSIFPSEKELAVTIKDQLLLEIGRSHFACILLEEKTGLIGAFELFNFDEIEAADFAGLLTSVSKDSVLLNKSYSKTQVYINNELSLLVPIFKFNKEIAIDYLNVVFGESTTSKVLFEFLPLEAGMMNVFRVSESCYNELNTRLSNVTFKHTWSKVVRHYEANSENFPATFMSIQFYDKYINVLLTKDEKVHLIQSFAYETPEDVLYQLLNITDRFELERTIPIRISGMIDLDFKLYRELIKYFQKVIIENVAAENTAIDIQEHPLHFFTPFVNLAL